MSFEKNIDKANTEKRILLFALSETRMFSYVENTESRKEIGSSGRENWKWIRKENMLLQTGREHISTNRKYVPNIFSDCPEGNWKVSRKQLEENIGRQAPYLEWPSK